jgi:hypothetical protein
MGTWLIFSEKRCHQRNPTPTKISPAFFIQSNVVCTGKRMRRKRYVEFMLLKSLGRDIIDRKQKGNL